MFKVQQKDQSDWCRMSKEEGSGTGGQITQGLGRHLKDFNFTLGVDPLESFEQRNAVI